MAQQPKVLAPHRPIAPRVAASKQRALPPAEPGSLVGGLWMTDANYKSQIYLRNLVETSAVTATPVLYLSNGVRYALDPVTIAPSGTKVVDVNAALQSKGVAAFATLHGYVEIDYNWPWNPLCATVRDVDVTHSLIFTYGVGPAMPPSQTAPAAVQTAEGLWWKQEPDVSGFVSLSNPSALPIPATVQVSDDQGTLLQTDAVTVSPHGTKLVAVSKLGATARAVGGVHVTYQSKDGSALVVNGGVADRNSGYSAAIPFLSSPVTSAITYGTTVAEIGLMTGAADPMMAFPAGTRFTPYSVMRNVSSGPLTLAPTAWWVEGGNSKSAPLPTLTLAPGESRTLDMPALLATTRLKNYNGSFTLAFDVQGKRGGLLMAAGSVDQTNTYVFEVTPRAATESASKSLAYWSTANGDDTMVNLWNPADEAQDLIFKLSYDGGHYSLPVHLAARATRMFNISEIIQAQIPDADGNIIPVSVREGSGRITGSQADNQHVLVAIDAGTYNVRKATCGQICFVCDGWVSTSLTPIPFDVQVDGTTQLDFQTTWDTGETYDITSDSVWSASGNITNGEYPGEILGLSPGATGISVTDNQEPICQEICLFAPADDPCPVGEGTGSGGSGTVGDATPIITGIDPSDWTAGKTQTVTFTGQYFGTNAPALTFSPDPGITYTLVTNGYSDTQINANITVPSGTTPEDVSVSVTNNGYGGSGFTSAGGGQSSKSAGVYATIHSPSNTPEITIVAWVDSNFSLPTGENTALQGALRNGTVAQQLICAAEVAAWEFGNKPFIITDEDVAYANAWLVQNSANYNSKSSPPPGIITPASIASGGKYRLFNDFGDGGGFYKIGNTPDPCNTGIIPGWAEVGQPSDYMGASGTSPSGEVYQLAEGRVGRLGQVASFTLNGRSVPWIWSVVEFNSSGTPTFSNVAIFPTYSVYKNGILTATYPQSSVASFTALDDTYQLTPSQIK